MNKMVSLDDMFRDDTWQFYFRLRKTSPEVLFASTNLLLAGKMLVAALEKLESIISIQDGVNRKSMYEAVRQHIADALTLLEKDDEAMDASGLFITTMRKHLNYLSDLIKHSADFKQFFSQLANEVTIDTQGIIYRMENEYRRLLFMNLR